MARFMKKPIIIEAFKLGHEDIPEWMPQSHYIMNDGSILIDTLEGTMKANVGDYIIKGVRGEVYPCKPDIFLETYERV